MVEPVTILIVFGGGMVGGFIGTLFINGPGIVGLAARVKRLELALISPRGVMGRMEKDARFGAAVMRIMELYQAKTPWKEIMGIMVREYPDVSFDLALKVVTGKLKIKPMIDALGKTQPPEKPLDVQGKDKGPFDYDDASGLKY